MFSYFYVNTNPSRSSSLSCQSFSTGVLLFKWIRSFQNSQDHLSVFPTLFVSSVPSCLCFPAFPPFFFKDSDFLIMYPSYGCEVSPFFSINVLTWWFSGRCSGSFKFIILHSRILFRWIQLKLSVLIIALSSFQMLSQAGISLNHSPLAIQLFRSAEDISEDSCFHSASILTILRLLSHSSRLIQPVQSPFQVIISTVFLLSGP